MIAYGILTPTEQLVANIGVFVVAPLLGALLGWIAAAYTPPLQPKRRQREQK